MGKKKSKYEENLKFIVKIIQEKLEREIDSGFNEIKEANRNLKLVLESSYGNRDEDVAILESRESSQDADNGWCGVPDPDSDYILDKQIFQEVNTY